MTPLDMVTASLKRYYGIDTAWTEHHYRRGGYHHGRWVQLDHRLFYMPWGDDRDREEFTNAIPNQAKMLCMYKLMGDSIFPEPETYIAQRDDCGELLIKGEWRFNAKADIIYQKFSKLVRISGSSDTFRVSDQCETAEQGISEILGVR